MDGNFKTILLTDLSKAFDYLNRDISIAMILAHSLLHVSKADIQQLKEKKIQKLARYFF